MQSKSNEVTYRAEVDITNLQIYKLSDTTVGQKRKNI